MQHVLDDTINYCIQRTITRPDIMFFPSTTDWTWTAADRRAVRNIASLRTVLRGIVSDRRKGISHSYDDGTDLIGILLTSDLFRDDENAMIDEVIVMFLAGMKTVAVSTANLISFLIMNPDKKEKLLAETQHRMEGVADDFVSKFTFELAEEMEYTKMCFYESLRMEPPVCLSQFNTPTSKEGVTISGVKIRHGDMFVVNMDAVSHDPDQW